MRLMLADMCRAKRPYRPDRDTGDATGLIVGRTPKMAQREDRVRLKVLRKADLHFPELAAEAMDLHDRIVNAMAAGEVPKTLASSYGLREACMGPVGHLWKGVEEYGAERVALVSLRPRDLLWEAETFMWVNPTVLKVRLRNSLDRAGVTGTPGWMLMSFDLEFDSNRGRAGVWDGHWHGIVGGDKIEALEALRGRRAFHNARVHPLERGMKEQPRVHVVKGLINLPHPICYCFKGWACHRPTFPNAEGLLERSKTKYRLPATEMIRWMLWIDMWSLDDLVLRNGLPFTRAGFLMSP
jgi:hypothetical protein